MYMSFFGFNFWPRKIKFLYVHWLNMWKILVGKEAGVAVKFPLEKYSNFGKFGNFRADDFQRIKSHSVINMKFCFGYIRAPVDSFLLQK